MRPRWFASSILLLFSSVPALASTATAPVGRLAPRRGAAPAAQPAAATVPPPCRVFRDEARATGSAAFAVSDRVSLAVCMASARLDALALRIDPAAVDASARAIDLAIDPAIAHTIDQAMAPSLAILDDVARHGDARAQVLADSARGDLDLGLVVRLRDAIPAAAVDAGPAAMTAFLAAHDRLESTLQPWQRQAELAFQDVDRVAALHPRLADRDAVLAHDILEARVDLPDLRKQLALR